MSNPRLVEALTAKYGRVKNHGDWIYFRCPTCTDKDRPKMKRHVSAHGYVSNCFICGIEKTVMELLDNEYMPAPSDFAYTEDKPKEVDPRSLILPYTKSIPVNQLDKDHPAIKFLNKDHLFDLDTYANVHKIVYVPYEGGMIMNNGVNFITSAERIVFPVYFEHKLVGWQMRDLPGTFYGDMKDNIRYYHVFPKGSYLYNYDEARKHKRVIVVEGIKKALKFPNGVATWGCGISRQQLKLIQTWKEVVMMLDSDKGNNTQQKARSFVAGINSGGGRAVNVDLAKYGVSSPDDLPSNILQQIADEEWNEVYNKHR